MKKLKILSICAVGINRSKYLSLYLRKKGYSTRYGGIDYRNEGEFKPVKQKDVEWADIVIVVRKRLVKILKKKFKLEKKKLIVIDVTDSKRIAGKKYPELLKLNHLNFQKRWTYPQLRKAIKPYLPFKNKMTFFIIIRGPLGCGKSTIAEKLSKRLNAKYFAIDRILDENKIEEYEEGYVSQKSFLKANEIAVQKAKKDLEKGIPVVFDGNFYWKSQIKDLIGKLSYPHYIFTLKAPLKVCIERDRKRKKTYGKDAAKAVYKKSNSFKYGIIINTENKSSKEVINEIMGKSK